MQNKIKSWYDKIASNYDTWGSREGEYSTGSFQAELASFRKLLANVGLGKNSAILDVATGTGTYLAESMKKGGKGLGIDLSPEIVKVAKRKFRKAGLRARFIVGDFSKLDLGNNRFNLMTCIGMFEYYNLNDTKSFIRKMEQHLDDHGSIILDLPNRSRKAIEFRNQERSVGHNVYIHDPKKIRLMLSSLGLKIVKKNAAGFEIQYLLKKI